MRQHKASLLLSLLLASLTSVVFWLTSPGEAGAQVRADEALEELRASDVEWRQSDSEFRRQRRDQALSPDAVADYAEFVAVLRRKMLESCQRFRTAGGDPDRLGFNCSLPKGGGIPGQEVPQNPAQVLTEQEKTESLKATLGASVHEFEKKLYEQQSRLRTEVATQTPAGSVPGRSARGDSGSDRAGAGNPASQRSGGPASAAGSSSRPDDSRAPPPIRDPGAGPGIERPAALVNSGTSGAVGDDDDVVARQLREAAEKEQDPVMKEKLWDEYRKYKTSRK